MKKKETDEKQGFSLKEFNNSKLALVFVIVSGLFMSFGQLFWKFGSNSLHSLIAVSITSYIFNSWIFLGFVFYGLGAISLMVSFKFGDLSYIYPFISLTFLWVALLSLFFLRESISLTRWVGIVFIGVGVLFITFSNKTSLKKGKQFDKLKLWQSRVRR